MCLCCFGHLYYETYGVVVQTAGTFVNGSLRRNKVINSSKEPRATLVTNIFLVCVFAQAVSCSWKSLCTPVIYFLMLTFGMSLFD